MRTEQSADANGCQDVDAEQTLGGRGQHGMAPLPPKFILFTARKKKEWCSQRLAMVR
jgi:hypothetical protein